MFDYIERAPDVFLASSLVDDSCCEHFCYAVPYRLVAKSIYDTGIINILVRKDRSEKKVTMLASTKSRITAGEHLLLVMYASRSRYTRDMDSIVVEQTLDSNSYKGME